jgi:anaerobic selenocysteine-containing dehydrogenase
LPFFSVAQTETTSRLDTIKVAKVVRVCIWPDYFSITYRNPKTQQLTGIDIDMVVELGKDLGVGSVEEVTAKLANTVPQFAPAVNTKALRHDGVLMNHPAPLTLSRTTLPVQDRNSYDYRIVSFRKLYDAAVGTAKSPSLAQLATGATVVVHPLDLARIGVELGANVQVISTKATAVLPVTTSEDVLRGTAWLPFNQPGNDAREIFDARADIVDVRIEKLA